MAPADHCRALLGFDFYYEYVGRERRRETRGGGGDFYNNQNTRVGELFATQVARAALEGRIGFTEAYHLTGLKGATFEKYASLRPRPR